MGNFASNYNKLRKKRLEEEQERVSTSNPDDIAPLFSSVDFSAPIIPSAEAVEQASALRDYRIAVKEQEEFEKNNHLVQAGAMEDASVGNFFKGVGATVGDIGLGVVKGAFKTAEGIADLLYYGGEQIAKGVGADGAADFMHEAASMNFVDDVSKPLDRWLDKNSFLGNKTEAVEEGLGQVAAIILTGGIGGGSQAAATVATTAVTGASSMGSSMSEAYQSGATDGEAWTYGAWSGAVDAGTELLFGGLGKAVNAVGVSKGISSLDDMFAKKLSSKISNQFAANMVEFGVKAGFEGSEEVLAGIGSAVGKKLTYMSDEELKQLIEDEDLLNQFVVGAVTSGIAQSGIVPGMQKGSLIESTAQGKDFITGLTQSEAAVVEKEVEKRISEKEAKGEKLTNAQKNKIYDQVVEELDKGYISIDTIQEAIGGEGYAEYKSMLDKNTALEAEAKDLVGEFKKLDMESDQSDRLEELRTKLNEISEQKHANDKEIADYKEWFDSEVFDLAKGSRLENSYIENDNKGKAFTADLSKYDEKTRATVQRAIDSGILNNTNRTHEFVDTVAKLSADKGVPFDFANNESLKESGFAIDGATINGVVTKDGIKINIDSPKAWQTTVGHEITHVLEGTELYTELQKSIIEYAKAKGDYQGRLDKLTKLYENVEGADINAELTADLVGDYLFEDSDFIANLSTQNRNVFQKIYDEIKYLLKLVTAGSKEARQLEAVKKAFDKAYKEGGKANVSGGDTKYSVSSTADSDGKTLTNEQKEYFKNSKMRDENGNLKVMYHGSQDAGFHVFDPAHSDDETSLFFVDRNDVAASYSGTSETYEAQTIRSAEDMNKFLAEIGYDSYKAVKKDGKFELLENNEHVAYSNTAQGLYEEFCWYEGVGEGDANYKVYLNLTNPLEVDAEGRNWNNISREYSQEIADRYNSLTAEEKDALTNLAEWGEYGIFKDEMLEARAAAEQGVSSGYGDVAFTKTLARAYEKLGGANANLYDAFSIASDNFSEDSIKEFAVKQMTTRDYAKKAKAEGYDGVIFKNIHDNGGYSNGSEGASTVAIAFSSNQVKSVANENPTKNADIRYSLSEDSEGRKLSENQLKYFEGSKVVDDSGKLKAVYHGSPADFNEFSLKYLGTNGTNEGYGFYFTDSKQIAEGYSKGREGQQNGAGGRLFEVYLDIKKPLSDTEVTMSKAQLKKLLIELNNQVDADGEKLDILSNYGDVEWEGLNNVLNYAIELEYDGNDNDVDIIQSVINSSGNMETVFNVLRKVTGYDGIIVNEASWGGDQTIYIAFHPEQIKNVDNLNPTDNPDIRRSLSAKGEAPIKHGDYYTPANELRYKGESIAPVSEDLTGKAETSAAGKNTAPIQNAVESEFEGVADGSLPVTEEEAIALQSEILNSLDDSDVPPEIAPTYYGEDVTTGEKPTAYNPFDSRDYQAVGKVNVKAFMDEHPEVKPFFKAEANIMLGELQNTTKGERWYNDWVYDLSYEGLSASNASYVSGTKRHTSDDIAAMLDSGRGDGKGGYTYDEIKAALTAIVEDKPKKNACAKRIEFLLHDRLMNGYKEFGYGVDVPPNQEYIDLMGKMQSADAMNEARQSYFDSVGAMDIAPPVANVNTTPNVSSVAPDPVNNTAAPGDAEPPKIATVMAEEPKVSREKRNILNKFRTNFADKGAVIEDLSLKTGNRELDAKYNFMHYSESRAQEYINKHLKPIVDVVESTGKTQQLYEYAYHLHNIDRMSLESNENRVKREALREKFKGLNDKQIAIIAKEWIKHDTPKDVADRIRAAREYLDTKKNANKPVFGDSVTADVSREAVKKLETENPEFKGFGEAIVAYNTELRKMLVEGNVISQETADLWAKQYPHYVPIRRLGKDGLGVTVPLDTRKTGVNAPIKRAKGGNSDILPLFDTMALRTEQTFKAVAKNSFGVELMHTLDTVIESEDISNVILPEGTQVKAHDRENIGVIKSYNEETGKYTVYFSNKKGQAATVQLDAKILTPLKPVTQATDGGVDEILDNLDNHEELLKKGENGQKPTFTVFENGKRVTFEITEDIYDSLKGTSDGLKYTNKVANTASNVFRGILTEYNPVFMVNNAVKDAQDVLINSQHPAKTYATIPEAIKELTTKGKWYAEYMENGGSQNTYFDSESKTFKEENSKWVKAVGMPIRAISEANNFIEKVPRLAEYIASRKAGASVEVAMLDAARVTTNFAAGGDVTKFLNRNGATFLNASVQGFNQQVRNVREAKANGVKGWLSLAAKVGIAGLPAVLLNNLLWDDDEDYEELSDYVKDGYYIVAKTEDGTFIRIPKGRTVAVIQNAFEQMDNLITGDDELDFGRFFELAISNLAPNNPIDNNLISPIVQTANNETWYGEDLVPTRLQDLPAAEQYDESTDKFSKWIGETFNVSPYKVNYLLDQYSGGVGDVVLPYLTPEADGGGILAPFKDKFTTDSVMNNQNVGDFYDTVDELTKNANSTHATDEDILKSKYMNSVSSELSALYQQKREIQNSDMRDKEKSAAVREIQEQIVSLTKNALGNYENINREGDYAEIGGVYFEWYKPESGDPYWRKLSDSQTTKYKLTKDAGNAHYVTDGNVHYRLDENGEWTKISDRQLERQNEVTKALGITPEEYWSKTDISFLPMSDGEYEYAYENPDRYSIAKAVGGYDSFKTYSNDLYNIKADKDSSGKSITGSRKEKVLDYINNLDVDYGIKLILFKSEYNADDTYNYEIVDYLNSRQDISYKEMETILKELGFTVDSNGNITWD